MSNEELYAVLQSAQDQEQGKSGFYNKANAEEAEDLGLIEVEGAGRISLTNMGRERLRLMSS